MFGFGRMPAVIANNVGCTYWQCGTLCCGCVSHVDLVYVLVTHSCMSGAQTWVGKTQRAGNAQYHRGTARVGGWLIGVSVGGVYDGGVGCSWKG